MLKEGDIVYHKVYGRGVILYVFTWKYYFFHRRSRFPYLVQFDSGHKDQFLRGELENEQITTNTIK